jgi:chromosome segregation ATPase
MELDKARNQREEFRQLSDRTKEELDGWVASVNSIQPKYMTALKDRGTFEADCKAARHEAQETTSRLDKSEAQRAKLEETNRELSKKLSDATDLLLNSTNPDVAKIAHLEKERDEAVDKFDTLEKRSELARNDLDFFRDRYQQQSGAAQDLIDEKVKLERKIQDLSRKADDNVVKVNEIQARSEVKALKRLLDEHKTILREREVELNMVRDELRALKSNRRETRQSSVPRSPRLGNLSGVMSPRNHNNHNGRTANTTSSGSRTTSPAPPTGLFDIGPGGHAVPFFGQQQGNGRYSHLRE